MTKESALWESWLDEWLEMTRAASNKDISWAENDDQWDDLDARMRANFEGISPEVAVWFDETLRNPISKNFLSPTLSRCGQLPISFLNPLIYAAIYEHGSSCYIEPAVQSFGPRLAMEQLLEWLECGTDQEKVGALRALDRVFKPSEFGVEEEQRRLARRWDTQDVSDLHARQRFLCLDTFIQNPNPILRGELLTSFIKHWDWLDENPENPELHPLIRQLFAIVRDYPYKKLTHHFTMHFWKRVRSAA